MLGGMATTTVITELKKKEKIAYGSINASTKAAVAKAMADMMRKDKSLQKAKAERSGWIV